MVAILQSVEDLWEDVVVDDNLSQIDGMLGDVGQTRGYLPFELSVLVIDQLSQEGDSSGIYYKLGELRRVLADFAQSGS